MRTLLSVLFGVILACAPQSRVPAIPGVLTGAGGGGGGGTGGLITGANLTWQGAFKLPCPNGCASDSNSFHFNNAAGGGPGMWYDSAGNSGAGSLLIGGFYLTPQWGEVTIPTVTTTTTLGSMPTATLLSGGGTSLTAACGTHANDILTGGSNYLGGIMRVGSVLYSNIYAYYDGSSTVSLSQCVNTSTGTYTSGPWKLGDIGFSICSPCAGHQAGWMFPVPSAWQASLGTSYLEGQCCLSIIARTSYGPNAVAWDPTQDGVTIPNPSAALLDYPQAHVTVGDWNSSGNYFNGASYYPQAVIVDNAIFYGGRLGTGTFCYGEGENNHALDGQPTGQGDVYCFDPLYVGNKGTHAYPYQNELLFYALSDLAAVHAGTKNPWVPTPYSAYHLTFPAGLDMPSLGGINGLAYDATNRRLFIMQANGTGDGVASPLVNIYSVSTAPEPEPLSLTTLLADLLPRRAH